MVDGLMRVNMLVSLNLGLFSLRLTLFFLELRDGPATAPRDRGP